MSRIAIVTGALGGIGTAIVKKLRECNYYVIAACRPNSENRALEWLNNNFKNDESIKTVYIDVKDFDMCNDVCQRLYQELGHIDVLVNNAGITRDSSFKKMTSDNWREVISTNLESCFNMSKAVFKNMSEDRFGRIINISSINGQKGQFGQVNYAASKSGMYGLTKSLALEGARKNITCNCISPGYIETEMTQQMSSDVLKQIVSEIPVGRLGRPDEVADIVAFLARESSGYITGANIAVNGGHHMY